MGAYKLTLTLVCDCGKKFQKSGLDRHGLQSEARAKGWRRKQKTGWVCPGCVKGENA